MVVLAKEFGVPPAAVNDLTLTDFAVLTDAADAEIRSRQPTARDGR